MSGIVGIFNLDGRPVDRGLLQAMVAAEAYRGPDEEGLWVQGAVGFGHRQLCTTPESLNEHQPVCLYEGRYAITCDGRVDNRGELIDALKGKAPVDAATPDADLILHAYIAWGVDCLKRIVGDFAFVIWDQRKQELFCARDPMGIRTFYYYQDGKQFVFASDIAAIFTDTRIPRELNEFMVALYLLRNFREAEQSFFKGIYQVPPACYLTMNRVGVAKHNYWQPAPWDEIKYSTTEEYVEHFRRVFFQAVQSHLRTTSPVGISLSGGLDSTSIACTAAHLIGHNKVPGVELRAYSSIFDDIPAADESEYIREVLETRNIRGQYIDGDQFWGFKPLREKGLAWNRPYPVPFQARHESLLRCANEAGVRIILTGEGGDELLVPGYGYPLDLLNNLKLNRLYRELRYLAPQSRRAFYMFALKRYRTSIGQVVPGRVKSLLRRLRPGHPPAWLSHDFIRSSGAMEHQMAPLPETRGGSAYRQSQFLGPMNVARLPYLPYVTEMYARHSIEARHPFFDRRVMDFLCRVPPHLKFSQGWTKYLLRKAMEGTLPDKLRRRPGKAHFEDAFALGVREEEGRIRTLLESGYLARWGWVNKGEARNCYDRALAGDFMARRLLMPLVTLEDWFSNYFDSNGGGALLSHPGLTQESEQERR